MPVILITGAARRIGRHLALDFAKKGWDIILHYNSSSESAKNSCEEILSLGVKCSAIQADLTRYSEIQSAFDKGFSEIGIPDVLINNAGIFPKPMALKELSPERWQSTLDTNLSSQFYSSKIFAEIAKSGSKIINIASLGGIEIWKHRIDYNVSKSGVIRLTKVLARELAPVLAVNCICPGAILMPEERTENDKYMQPLAKIPMGRYGTPDDIFDAAWFFATTNNYITGQVITVDGGVNLVR